MPRDILELPAPPADRRLTYGPGALHFGDLRLPAGDGPHPAVVYIHGGFWRAKYGLDHAGHFCEALRSAGVATWNIEYRRVGQDGGGWPGTLDDVLRAARFIEQIARSHPIDLDRVLVAGHSAGGQLALWVAAQDAIELLAAVSFSGVVDLRRAFELHLGDGAVEEFLGVTPEQVPGRYDTASPIELLPIRIPQLLIHGTRDDVVPIELSERFSAASENCEIRRLEGADHFDAIDPRSAHWPVIAGALLGSLSHTLAC
jgi:acetyl esterase/lipase